MVPLDSSDINVANPVPKLPKVPGRLKECQKHDLRYGKWHNAHVMKYFCNMLENICSQFKAEMLAHLRAVKRQSMQFRPVPFPATVKARTIAAAQLQGVPGTPINLLFCFKWLRIEGTSCTFIKNFQQKLKPLSRTTRR